MIEIIREEKSDVTKERGGLPKDIKQIGKPDIGDRIYVENQVYQYMHPYHSCEEAAAYVLLGRFENYTGKQCVFVEAAIRLEEITFEGEVPVWNDQTWAYIYKQLKREYDSMVIVGWALDIKGQLPNLTAKIEALHQNNFGGPHQVLFLMDSLEREETFYCSRNSHLYRREGFYVYYRKSGEWAQSVEEVPVPETVREERSNAAGAASEEAVTLTQEELRMLTGEPVGRLEESTGFSEESMRFSEESLKHVQQAEYEPTHARELFGRKRNYRQLRERKQKKSEWNASYAYTGLLVAIVCALGATVYQNYQKLEAMETAIAQMNRNQAADTETMAITVETVAGNIEKQEKPEAGTTDGQTGTPEASQSTEQVADAVQEGDTEQAEDVAAAENTAAENTETGSTETEAMTEAQTYLKQGYYVVQKGDSLLGICREIYQDTAMLEKLCEVNGIEDMDAIYAGQYLTLPN